MRLLALSALLSFGACKPDPVAPPAPAPTAPEPADTGWAPGAVGQIHLAHSVNKGETAIFGVFAESLPPFLNVAQCAISGGTCMGYLPEDEDASEDFDKGADLERETLSTVYAGMQLRVGPYTLPYLEDPRNGFGGYVALGSGAPEPFGQSIGVSWDSLMGSPYQGTDDLFVPDPIELLSPALDSDILFTNGREIPIEWVPTGTGFVTLTVANRFTFSRIWLLEDDGYFALDVDSLGLLAVSDELTFTLSRWNSSELRHQGNIIELLATSSASFEGTYLRIGDRELKQPSDACGQARGSLPLEPGGYWGVLGYGLDHDFSAPWECLEGDNPASYGPDGVFKVELAPRHALSVEYNLLDASASVYFVGDCGNVRDTCIDGSDATPFENDPEYLQLINVDDEPKVAYLILDTTEYGDASPFTLDLVDTPLPPPTLYDTCFEASQSPPHMGNAVFYGDFLAWQDDLDPTSVGCTGSAMTGADAVMPVAVPPGQTLFASLSMQGGDGGLYVLTGCQPVSDCADGSDIGGVSANEQVSYTNETAVPQTVMLVVDSKGVGLRPFFLSVFFQ